MGLPTVEVPVTFQMTISKAGLQKLLESIKFQNEGGNMLVKFEIKEEENKIILTYE